MSTVEMEEILPELILNWDQMGIKIVPSNTWTMDRQSSRRVEAAEANDKRLITAVFFLWFACRGFSAYPGNLQGQNATVSSPFSISFQLGYYAFPKALVK